MYKISINLEGFDYEESYTNLFPKYEQLDEYLEKYLVPSMRDWLDRGLTLRIKVVKQE